MTSRIERTSLALSACLLLAGVACDPAGQGAEQPDSEKATPLPPEPVDFKKEEQPSVGNGTEVHRLTLSNGNAFRFMQVPDDRMFVFEHGAYPTAPTRIDLPKDKRTMRDLYKFLAPDQPMPAALAAAIEKFERRHPGQLTLPTPASDVSAISQAVTWDESVGGDSPAGCPFDWFVQNHCWNLGTNPVCQKDTSYSKSRVVSEVIAASCTAAGTSQITLKYSACSYFWCPTYTLFSEPQVTSIWFRDILNSSGNQVSFWYNYTVRPSSGGRAHTAINTPLD